MRFKRKLYTSAASKVLKNKEARDLGMRVLGKTKEIALKSGKKIQNPAYLSDEVLKAGRKAEKDLGIGKLGKNSSVHERILHRGNKFTKPGRKGDHYGLSYVTISSATNPNLRARPDAILREGHGLSRNKSIFSTLFK